MHNLSQKTLEHLIDTIRESIDESDSVADKNFISNADRSYRKAKAEYHQRFGHPYVPRRK